MALTDGSELIPRLKDALLHRRLDEGADLLAEARRAPPREPLALRTLAHAATLLGDEEASLELLAGAIAACGREPAPADWYRALGERCTSLGRLSEAIRAFRAAVAGNPADVDTWRWLARVLRRVDDVPGAIAASRRAVELLPDDWAGLADLATVLVDAGEDDEAAEVFARARARGGDLPVLVVGRAKLEASRGRVPEALAALEDCLERHPGNVPALATLALLLRDAGRFAEACALAERAVAASPHDAALWCGWARSLLHAGRAEEAFRAACSLLQRKPGHAGGLSVLTLALAALGDERATRRLLDYERLVVSRRLELPAGYATLEAFNAALVGALQEHPTLHRAPRRHATVAGWHSGSLLVDPAPPVVAFLQAVRGAVSDYAEELRDGEEPFNWRRPSAYGVDSWCVVMERGGHQVPHVHPEGWLSGCYYPALPDALRRGEGDEGCLSFGEPDRDFPAKFAPRVVRVRPEEGRLVLFPSYFFHRTLPFDSEGRRFSVAFDLIPTASKGA